MAKISLILVGAGIVISLIGGFFVESSLISFLFHSIRPLLVYFVLLLLPLIFEGIAFKKNSRVFGILSVAFSILFVVIVSLLSFSRVRVVY